MVLLDISKIVANIHWRDTSWGHILHFQTTQRKFHYIYVCNLLNKSPLHFEVKLCSPL